MTALLWKSRYRPQSSTRFCRASAGPAGSNNVLAAGQFHRSIRHPLRHDEETDASAEHYPERGEPQSVPHSFAHLATTGRYSSSSAELLDLHALRLAPGLSYMPQSASVV